MTTTLRCYCCGDEIADRFALVHMQKGAADRVFIFSIKHAVKVENPKTVIIVKRLI